KRRSLPLAVLTRSAEEWVFVRSVDFEVTGGAVRVARVVDVVERRGSSPDSCAVRVWNAGSVRMAFETEELDDVARQQFRVGRAVRRVADLAAFDFDRSVLVNERTLFVSMTFDAGRIAAG